MEWLAAELALEAPRAAVLEIGSRNVNGSAREAFNMAARYWGVDIAAGPGVDQVADGAAVVPPFEPDTVVCCEVLEHTPAWREIVRHACEVLAPGGLLLVTAACDPRAPHSATDGGRVRVGEYYGNVEPAELGAVVREAGLAGRVSVFLERGDVYVVGRKPWSSVALERSEVVS
jgi:hypothetical protein